MNTRQCCFGPGRHNSLRLEKSDGVFKRQRRHILRSKYNSDLTHLLCCLSLSVKCVLDLRNKGQEHCRSPEEGGSIYWGCHQSTLLKIWFCVLHSTLTLLEQSSLELATDEVSNQTELPPLTSGNCIAGHQRRAYQRWQTCCSLQCCMQMQSSALLKVLKDKSLTHLLKYLVHFALLVLSPVW